MNQLLQAAPPVSEPEQESRVIRLADADDTFRALSSSTARSILLVLYEETAPASVVADRVDSSVQNVQYHLDRLREADLVDVVGTKYSSKGVEMDIWAPTNEPLVITVGDSDPASARPIPDHR